MKRLLCAAITIANAAAENTADLVFQSTIRQQYPIAEAGLSESTAGRAPVWLRIVASDGTPRNEEQDFRDELNIKILPKWASLRHRRRGKRDPICLVMPQHWKKVGYIEFTDSDRE